MALEMETQIILLISSTALSPFIDFVSEHAAHHARLLPQMADFRTTWAVPKNLYNDLYNDGKRTHSRTSCVIDAIGAAIRNSITSSSSE